MSKETDKLAAEMQNLKPSKTSRKGGMNAAMAAFDMEFAQEVVKETVTEAVQVTAENAQENTQKNQAEEKISTPAQGLKASARPTGQNTHEWRVMTSGRDMMTRFSNVMNSFKFTPRAAMMGGSCMAALLVSMVFYNAGQFGTAPVNTDTSTQVAVVEPLAVEPVTAAPTNSKAPIAPKATASADEVLDTIVVTGTKVAPSQPQDRIASLEGATPEFEAPKVGGVIQSPAPVTQSGGIGYALNKARQEASRPPHVLQNKEADMAIQEYRAVLQKKDNIQLFVAQQDIVAQSQTAEISSLKRQLETIEKTKRAALTTTNNRQTGGLTLEEVPAEYKTETHEIVVQEASTELVAIPATFETVTETVVVTPESIETEAVPAEYEWVDGEIEGGSVEYVNIPAQFQTVAEAVSVQEASTELVTIPATYNLDGTVATPARTQERTIPSVTKMISRRVVKTPASTAERFVPNVIKDGKTRVAVKPATVVERAVPAVTKEVSRRVIKTPARTQERVVPAGSRKEVAVRTQVSPQRFYLRDEDGKIVKEFKNRDAFEKYKSNLTTSVQETPVSTFSIDVDTASYSFMRASLNRGQLPPRASIRLEEMINYFPYDYEAPRSADEPFKANVTVTPTPWNADTKLMHIGIKGYVPPKSERPRSNIVFLIDTSGSMNQTNKLPLLINSFKLLLNTLDADDTVSIVTYAGRAGTVLEPTPASDKHTIKEALTRLRAGGSTAGAAGLELAYQKAQEGFDDEANNRVILATDGDFNVGFSSHEDMKTFITKKRKTGIFLSVLGFGQGNYNDQLMQSLAQNGNGVAAYIDNLSEANKVLANEAGSALITIAKDVKIQVEFNPDTVSEYRLIGYETRALKRQDFNNDKVDAGEIGAGHNVTAIYELTPVGSKAEVFDPLRYVEDKLKGTGSDEFAFVKIRHKLPTSDTSTLQTFPVGPKQERKLKRTSDDMRFAAAVAAVGQKLRGDTHLEDFSYDDAIKLANGAKGKDENGYRSEFIQLIRLAKGLQE